MVRAILTAALNGLFYQLSTAASGGAAMLFGVSIDGVLLLYYRFLHERARGASPDEASGLLAATVISVGMGFTTTAATYFSLMTIDFPALEEIGRLIGIGILMSGLFTVLLVPGLLPTTLPRVRLPTTDWLGRFVGRFTGPIIGTAIVFTLALGAASIDLRVVPSLEELQPDTLAAQAEAALMERFQIHDEAVLILAQGADLEILLQTNHKIAEGLQQRAPDVPIAFPHTFVPITPPLTKSGANMPDSSSFTSDTPVTATGSPDSAIAAWTSSTSWCVRGYAYATVKYPVAVSVM